MSHTQDQVRKISESYSRLRYSSKVSQQGHDHLVKDVRAALEERKERVLAMIEKEVRKYEKMKRVAVKEGEPRFALEAVGIILALQELGDRIEKEL